MELTSAAGIRSSEAISPGSRYSLPGQPAVRELIRYALLIVLRSAVTVGVGSARSVVQQSDENKSEGEDVSTMLSGPPSNAHHKVCNTPYGSRLHQNPPSR